MSARIVTRSLELEAEGASPREALERSTSGRRFGSTPASQAFARRILEALERKEGRSGPSARAVMAPRDEGGRFA